jgi:segregation and condensation protein B
VTKRKKPAARPAADAETAQGSEVADAPSDSVTTGASDVLAQAMNTARASERAILAEVRSDSFDDIEATVNVTGDMLPFPGRDDLDEPTVAVDGDALDDLDGVIVQRKHLRGLIEALVFASDQPIKPTELAKLASAQLKLVKELLEELKKDYSTRGFHLEEVAGGWVFRTSPQYAPFIRDLTKQRPVRLTRAQVETLAIIAYRQPITRPEIDDVRGVDSGPVLKVLLERDLVRILGKRDEPGRPLIYGTTNHFLEFFGLKSLKDLPTLREFTELTDESREKYEEELGEPPGPTPPKQPEDAQAPAETAAGDDDEPSTEVRESMAVPAGVHDELADERPAEGVDDEGRTEGTQSTADDADEGPVDDDGDGDNDDGNNDDGDDDE